MKTIVSTLIALSVIVGLVSATSDAFDPKTFWEQQESRGG
jgi:hypothetical protein